MRFFWAIHILNSNYVHVMSLLGRVGFWTINFLHDFWWFMKKNALYVYNVHNRNWNFGQNCLYIICTIHTSLGQFTYIMRNIFDIFLSFRLYLSILKINLQVFKHSVSPLRIGIHYICTKTFINMSPPPPKLLISLAWC